MNYKKKLENGDSFASVCHKFVIIKVFIITTRHHLQNLRLDALPSMKAEYQVRPFQSRTFPAHQAPLQIHPSYAWLQLLGGGSRALEVAVIRLPVIGAAVGEQCLEEGEE